MKLHALKGVELPGKVLSFDIVPLDPALKDGTYGALAGQMSFLYSVCSTFKPALTIDRE